jgi:lysophospholipase L1-like esterase
MGLERRDEGGDRVRRSLSKVRGTTLVALVAATLSMGAPAVAQSPPYPDSMAAIGDSITQAVNVCCWYGNHPGQSWSTGGASWDGIKSHYERLRAVHPPISGNRFNDSVSGAKMKNAPAQAAKAVSQGAEYVTILMGANDVCTSSRATMTSVGDFQAQFEETMATLAAGFPNARIFVSSIPNVYHLWQILHSKPLARLVWDLANICQSMLASSNTETDRQKVLAREIRFNDVLATVCAQYSNCRFDGYRVFNEPFTVRDISSLDYFHPSLSGQAKLARVTWATSWWPA